MRWRRDTVDSARIALAGLASIAIAGLSACSDVERGAQASANKEAASCRKLSLESAEYREAPSAPAAAVQPAAGYVVDGRPKSADLSAFFAEIGYRLPAVRQGMAAVPRIEVGRLPVDLRGLNDVAHRKAIFLATILPMALHLNESIRRERAQMILLADCRQRGIVLPNAADAWLAVLHEKYETGGDGALLRKRVDIIPASLVLAQAAIESGWGTSRFALEGNALFGERTYGGHGGLVPNGIGAEAAFRVRSFDSVYHSIEAYANNLNVTAAYKAFRDDRARRRASGAQLSGAALARYLDGYSERGEDYVQDVLSIVNGNDLHGFDCARLEPPVHGRARNTVRFGTNAAQG